MWIAHAQQAFLIAAVTVTAAAAWTDHRTGEIPHGIVLPPLVIAPLAHYAVVAKQANQAAAFQALGFSIVGALVTAAVPLFLYFMPVGEADENGDRPRAIYGGDVKLFAAIGAICRATIGIEAVFYSFIASALVTLGVMAWQGKLLRTLGNVLFIAVNPFLPKARRKPLTPENLTMTRMGPAIFLGTLATAALHWIPTREP
jgi:prepilin peptidase CpaA